MSPLTYTFAEIREGLHLATDQATRNRLQLLEAEGFPKRLPGTPPRWSKPAVDQWLLHWGSAKDFAPQHISIEAQRREADAQFGH